jgi:hypothetical protein
VKLLVVVNEDGPETRAAAEIAEHIALEGTTVETFQWESEEAADIARLYDIYSPPAFIAVRDDGALVEMWQGDLPLESDIKHFL